MHESSPFLKLELITNVTNNACVVLFKATSSEKESVRKVRF